MKTIKLILVISSFLSVYVLLSCQSAEIKMTGFTRFTCKDAMEVLGGTWINKDYELTDIDEFKIAELTLCIDCDYYYDRSSWWPEPLAEGTLSCKNAWKDQEGNIWVKATVKFNGQKNIDLPRTIATLYKVNESGTIMEEMIFFSNYNAYTEIDPDSEDYRIYYRQ